MRSVTLIAPNLFGTVQVTKIAPLGALAQEKDLVVEFDDSERRASLEETQLEVEQIDEQIKKAQADLTISDNQDQVDLLKARYAVRRAELEVQRNELLAEIDAKKNLLNLEEAKRRLQQLRERREITPRTGGGADRGAGRAAQQERDRRGCARRCGSRRPNCYRPMTGLVAMRQNRAQGFFFPGMQIPDIREGDTLQPGMPVADILDLSEFEVLARVGELDRANLHEGQDVTMQLDAVPDQHFHGKIKTMSGTASANIFSGDPGKKFDVVFSIDMPQLLTALGAKPADVKRILETAEHNAKKAPPAIPEPNKGADMAKMATELPPEFGTEEERERAQLPPSPEEDSQLQVLLRPGLLADVEITVERIPNAIHIPAQGFLKRMASRQCGCRPGGASNSEW